MRERRAAEASAQIARRRASILTHGDNRDCPKVRDGIWDRCHGHNREGDDVPRDELFSTEHFRLWQWPSVGFAIESKHAQNAGDVVMMPRDEAVAVAREILRAEGWTVERLVRQPRS